MHTPTPAGIACTEDAFFWGGGWVRVYKSRWNFYTPRKNVVALLGLVVTDLMSKVTLLTSQPFRSQRPALSLPHYCKSPVSLKETNGK